MGRQSGPSVSVTAVERSAFIIKIAFGRSGFAFHLKSSHNIHEIVSE
jgi:hypothetical protein